MVSVDQSTLAEDHFAYCYDKPRKTDVEKLLQEMRYQAQYGCYAVDYTRRVVSKAADQIERLTKSINDAINYCYKYEAEHDAGHPGTGALIPMLQDLQVAVGR